MTLRSFVDGTGPPDCTLAVVGGDSSEPLTAMLEETFRNQSIDVETRTDLEADEGTAVLLENETVVASSPLSELYDALLAINSDLYVTGARDVDGVELPAVLAALDETRFELRGYPLAHREKLLLIVVSRTIERLALETGAGTLRSAFQRLSRIEDEAGTRTVYERLAESDVAVHAYGVPDRVPDGLDVTIHGGTDDPYRDVWFVVFRPDPSPPAEWTREGAALVALETESRIWDGFWTRDPERVAAIDEYVEATL